MSHPGRPRVNPLERIEVGSGDIERAFGLTYKRIDYWTTLGVIHPDQVSRSSDHHHAEGSGSIRLFNYPQVQELVLVSVLRPLCRDLDVLSKVLSPVPREYLSWGELIVKETEGGAGLVAVFDVALQRDPPVLVQSLSDFRIPISSPVGTVVDISRLRHETDAKLQEVI